MFAESRNEEPHRCHARQKDDIASANETGFQTKSKASKHLIDVMKADEMAYIDCFAVASTTHSCAPARI